MKAIQPHLPYGLNVVLQMQCKIWLVGFFLVIKGFFHRYLIKLLNVSKSVIKYDGTKKEVLLRFADKSCQYDKCVYIYSCLLIG